MDIPMTDMLVKLYALPEVMPLLNILNQKGLEIRRAHAYEKYVLSKWVRQHFTDSSWAVSCEVALEHRPVIRVYTALRHYPRPAHLRLTPAVVGRLALD
jgi:hypothetical protein